MKDPGSVNKLRKAGWAILGVLLLAGGIVLVMSVLRDNSVPQPKIITTVMRVVIPPPPPPPPKLPPPPLEKMLEQPKVTEQEPKPVPKPVQPKSAPAKPAAIPAPPSSPLTAEAAPGPNPYGLAVGNGEGNVIGGGGGGGGGSQFGYYANLLQSQIRSALQQEDKTRFGRYRLLVRLWLNATGQVTRAQIVNSTGDMLMDDTITKILNAISVGEGPPQDMPQPVNVRIGAQS